MRVFSLVDKFLEHSRIFYFENAGNPEVFLGSADWMPRNFFRRIELMFPIEDQRLKTRIVDEILRVQLSDNVKARQLRADGNYVRVAPREGETPVRSQVVFQSLARGSARESGDHLLPFVPASETKDTPAPVPERPRGDGAVLPRRRKARVRITRPRDPATEPGGTSS